MSEAGDEFGMKKQKHPTFGGGLEEALFVPMFGVFFTVVQQHVLIRRIFYTLFRFANPNTHIAVDCKSWAVER